MRKDFVLPDLAESVVEGEIVTWLVPEGATVAADQPIVEVMTDKVTVELPAPFAGVLVERHAREGDVVAVGALLARIDTSVPAAPRAAEGGVGATARTDAPSDAVAEVALAGAPADAAGAHALPGEDDGDRLSLFKAEAPARRGPVLQVRRGDERARPDQAPSPRALDVAVAPPPPAGRGPFGRVVAVPAARRLARELGVAIEAVAGSGPQGRVRVADVEAHGAAPAAPGGAGLPAPVRYRTPAGYEDREERIPLRGVRRVTAQQMTASHLHAVRTLHVDEADVSALVRLRERIKARAEARGVKLTYLPFVMKAVVAALRAFPALNTSLDDERQEIVRKRYVNLGMAVATESGLVVPVVKDADRKSLVQLAADVQSLAAAAREGRLTGDDVRGGTFSITNIGSVGGLFSFPIINVPEAAILGVHSIKKRPVVLEDDTIAARPMLYLSLSFDHRLVDGAEAARFTRHLIDILETPEALVLDA
jgi:2-oxoisovalerate dehydrogenase E2 component (dihydrolipoyl transacylase)